MKKNFFIYIKYFFVLQLCFVLFATASCLLPNSSIKRNIEESVKTYHDEVIYPQHLIKQPAHQYDNFMDFLIMNLMYNTSPHKPFKYVLFPQGHFSPENSWSADEHIKFSIENRESDPNFIYGRYWHGSSFAYRWLFSIASLTGVRWLNFAFCSLILFAFVHRLGESLKKPEMYSLLAGLIFANYYLIFHSFQFAPVFIIALLGAVSIIKRIKQHRRIDVLFLVLGALTCYFDLLTVPVITLGIPLLVWIAMQPESIDLARKIKNMIAYSLLWFFGYVATWSFKWLLIYAFTDYSIIDEIKEKIGERGGVWRGTRWDAIKANSDMLNWTPLYVLLFVSILLMAFHFNRNGLQKAVLFLMVACIPFLWMFATANHVEMHSWFTYRSQWITISGLLLALCSLTRWDSVRFLRIKKKQNI